MLIPLTLSSLSFDQVLVLFDVILPLEPTDRLIHEVDASLSQPWRVREPRVPETNRYYDEEEGSVERNCDFSVAVCPKKIASSDSPGHDLDEVVEKVPSSFGLWIGFGGRGAIFIQRMVGLSHHFNTHGCVEHDESDHGAFQGKRECPHDGLCGEYVRVRA